MRGRRSSITGLLATGAAVVALAACTSEREVGLPEEGEIAVPTFITVPADLADSPQLDALIERRTAGLEPTSTSANGELLAGTLAALAAIDDPPRELSRLSIYDDSVLFSFYEKAVTGRTVSGYYEPGGDVVLGEPTYSEQATFPIAAIDAAVPQRLIEAVEQRFPQARVTSIDLDVDLSYDLGLVWLLRVDDAQGSLANIFAGLDGAIVAVDQD